MVSTVSRFEALRDERLTIGSRFLLRFVSEDVRTNMYIFLDGTRFLVIDPHPASEALAFLRKAGVSECTVLLTHEHPDHTCGIYSLQREWKTELICQEACGCAIADLNNNHPALIVAMLAVQDMRNGTNTAEHFRQYYEAHVYIPDVTFSTKFELKWGQERFFFVSTPGHTAGSCCIIWNDTTVFTGDSLLLNTPTITRLPGGSTKQYKNITLPFLKSLPRDMFVLPGHGPEFRMADVYHGAVHVEFVGV